MLQLIAIFTITEIIRANCCFFGEDSTCSSTIRTTANHLLHGYTFRSERMHDILKCAQACLGDDRCLSFNFEHTEGGECQLNTKNAVTLGETLLYSKRFTYGEMQNRPSLNNHHSTASKFIFTTLGAKGRSGPKNTHGYNGTNLEGCVRLDNGMQLWTVPKPSMYVIEAYGASGADGTCRNNSGLCNKGGLGAKITGSFFLEKNTMLTILVGQEGQLDSKLGSTAGGGGGGGTFVLNTEEQSPLIVAGGGGGGGQPLSGFHDGDPGQEKENGSRCGGFDRMGGQLCNSSGWVVDDLFAGSGAGFNGNGVVYPAFCTIAKSFTNGGFGARGPSSEGEGGFGGGGHGMYLGGGGGGYSGGGVVGSRKCGTAGGGGSFNRGTCQDNKAGINKGDGSVIIKMI